MTALKHQVDAGQLWNEEFLIVGEFGFFNGPDRADDTTAMLGEARFREVDRLICLATKVS